MLEGGTAVSPMMVVNKRKKLEEKTSGKEKATTETQANIRKG
jgi:hypothetical protein